MQNLFIALSHEFLICEHKCQTCQDKGRKDRYNNIGVSLTEKKKQWTGQNRRSLPHERIKIWGIPLS